MRMLPSFWTISSRPWHQAAGCLSLKLCFTLEATLRRGLVAVMLIRRKKNDRQFWCCSNWWTLFWNCMHTHAYTHTCTHEQTQHTYTHTCTRTTRTHTHTHTRVCSSSPSWTSQWWHSTLPTLVYEPEKRSTFSLSRLALLMPRPTLRGLGTPLLRPIPQLQTNNAECLHFFIESCIWI